MAPLKLGNRGTRGVRGMSELLGVIWSVGMTPPHGIFI